jgi:hypothetical protein
MLILTSFIKIENNVIPKKAVIIGVKSHINARKANVDFPFFTKPFLRAMPTTAPTLAKEVEIGF